MAWNQNLSSFMGVEFDHFRENLPLCVAHSKPSIIGSYYYCLPKLPSLKSRPHTPSGHPGGFLGVQTTIYTFFLIEKDFIVWIISNIYLPREYCSKVSQIPVSFSSFTSRISSMGPVCFHSVSVFAPTQTQMYTRVYHA